MKRIIIGHKLSIFMSFVIAVGLLISAPVHAANGGITVIHTGDFHGHLIPRPNVRSDNPDRRLEGGIARVYKVIKEIRKDEKNVLLLHTGDTIQGSAEVLYTQGQAIVDVLNKFKIDAFAPGNWEFVYGTERFLELFVGKDGNPPLAPWNTIAANVYYSTLTEDPTTPYPDKAGQRVLPPYIIKQVGNLKVGILGLTTDRGPQVVGSKVTKGFKFLKNTATELDAEVQNQVNHLRNVEQVDLLIMLSEMGLANNIRLSESIPGIDVILSSDMHEETLKPVVTSTGTIIVEEGQDGTMMGKLKLEVENKRVVEWEWKPIRISDKIKEDSEIAALIKDIRKTFISGPDFVQHINPFNGSKLTRAIDTVIGYTAKPLHRSNFSQETMPAVIEGSSHDMLTDAFRVMTGAQVGAIRGFRYGTHVPVGPIKFEDLFHFIPIGPQIAVGTIKGQAIKNQIENSADGSLNPDVSKWTGGWLFNFSNVTMNFDPYQTLGNRASSIMVGGILLDVVANYTYASYWYTNDPCMINVIQVPGCTSTGGVPSNITILKDTDGGPLDGTEVVARYIESQPNMTVDPVLNRITLVNPLPAYRFGFPEVQPLRGAQ